MVEVFRFFNQMRRRDCEKKTRQCKNLNSYRLRLSSHCVYHYDRNKKVDFNVLSIAEDVVQFLVLLSKENRVLALDERTTIIHPEIFLLPELSLSVH